MNWLLVAIIVGSTVISDVLQSREMKRHGEIGDFRPGRFSQRIGDVAAENNWEANREIFERAEVVFVDGPKDGRWEDRFIELLEQTEWFRPRLVVFDDVRLWKMLKTWRNIARPKIDLASFGHFTGTGLVEWTPQEP